MENEDQREASSMALLGVILSCPASRIGGNRRKSAPGPDALASTVILTARRKTHETPAEGLGLAGFLRKARARSGPSAARAPSRRLIRIASMRAPRYTKRQRRARRPPPHA